MTAFEGDALNSFARWKSYVYGHDIECFDHGYESLVARSAAPEFGSAGTSTGRRQWYYLQCTQLGLFSITDELSWIPNNLGIEYHLQKCSDIFGEAYEAILLQPSIVALQNEFGSLYQRVTNVVNTNGVIDTWLYNGMLLSRDVNSTVINIFCKSIDMRVDNL